jgi:hypothetical protein
MHVAVAMETPVVSVFGPTNPVWIGPYGRPHAVVRAGVSCAPCNLRRLRDCPHDHRCIREVSGRMVIERVERELDRSGVFAGLHGKPSMPTGTWACHPHVEAPESSQRLGLS